MNASNQLATYLPYVVGALLIGAALLGSFLPPARRAQVERRVLLPLYLVLGVAYLAIMIQKHNWLLTGIAAMAVIYLALSLYRRLWPVQQGAGK